MSPLRLLDLTRSLRRAGRMATGIDRVERAYLSHFVSDDMPCLGLVRTRIGYLLLDADGMRGFLTAPDHLTETRLRSIAVARCLPFRLSQMLVRECGTGFDYFNVGHSNLTDRVFHAIRAAEGQSHVLIHDVIPLEYPAYQREGTVTVFEQKLHRVGRFADRVIYNSFDTRQRAEKLMQHWGRVPPSVVAHLGVTLGQGDPDQTVPAKPYFMILGTIEPRKNHAFLLDIWDQLGPDAPLLLICGRRGWNNEDVFRRLDRLPPGSPVRELKSLSDGAVETLLRGSAGLLFPSHAEGFGLPAAEALSVGTRVLCNDLPVFREVLGQFGNFVPVSDSNSWLDSIKKWETNPTDAGKNPGYQAPSWEEHFNTVLRLS